MADFGDFLTGFTGSLMQQQQVKDENAEWEKRQRLLADLDVDKHKRLNATERKDGQTFKDEAGQWVTQELDGGGNPVGVRPARPAEIAAVEAATLGVEMDRDEFGYRGTKRKMEEEEHRSNMEYRRGSLDLQRANLELSRERNLLARQAGEGSGVSPESMVDSWLNSNEGKMAVKAYAATMGRVVESNPNIGGGRTGMFREGADEEKLYAGYEQLKNDILQTIEALPPEERPKTESQFRALVSRLAGNSARSLDRYVKPNQ